MATESVIDVLIVDDDPHIVEVIAALLQMKLAVSIYQENSVLRAIRTLRKSKARILISDIAMPELNGLTFCELVSRERLTEHILMMSGAVEPRDQQLAVSCGAHALIDKTDVDLLVRTVTEWLHEAGREELS